MLAHSERVMYRNEKGSGSASMNIGGVSGGVGGGVSVDTLCLWMSQ